MKSYRQIVEEAKTEIPEVTIDDVKAEQEKDSDFVLMDVRDEDEYRAGYIPNAVHVTRGMLEFSVENYIPDRDPKGCHLLCGRDSVLSSLPGRFVEMGYTDTVSLAGGYRDWSAAGYPTAQDKPMSHEQLDRYSRHFMLTEVGEQGQAKLLDAKVLLVGSRWFRFTCRGISRCRWCRTHGHYRFRCRRVKAIYSVRYFTGQKRSAHRRYNPRRQQLSR